MTFVGIDLGTTNSAVCSYDGENVTLYKSPEQHDVTPSAIYFDRRGNKYIGSRALYSGSRDPGGAATSFKRLMGTSTPIELPSVNRRLTPEECSAEILRLLFGYLPDSIRNSPATGTVVTVPAAFNSMQRDATMTAASLADIENVALMQEPVAAVMSIMKARQVDGIFLVFDLGGGTLDVAVAESLDCRVSLLAHGGIEMCGGRDFDRLIYERYVQPWLRERFKISDVSAAKYEALERLALAATERAKIELSQRGEAVISLPESEIGVRDDSGADIYLDIPLRRHDFDSLIHPKVAESIDAAKDTLAQAGLTSRDVERVVFVGGPTQYQPLRDKIASALGIAPSTEVNPMTAVAAGAAIFAESIDWESGRRERKSARGTLSPSQDVAVAFNFVSRTPASRAPVVSVVTGQVSSGCEFQIDSLESGWSSGRVALQDGASVEVPLHKPGENTFKVFVFDAAGGPMTLATDRITITRTAASIDAIPASHSLGIEARSKVGGPSVLDFLVRQGDQLPAKGRKTFRAEEALRFGSSGALRFKLWEGEIEASIHDNRLVGMLEIRGSDLGDDGLISAGAELICDYEVLDSGHVLLEIAVPSAGIAFPKKNFYSRQEGQIDYSNAGKLILEEVERTEQRLSGMTARVEDERLSRARTKLADAQPLATGDPESAKQAMDHVQEAKALMAKARKDHLVAIRQAELDRVVGFFNDSVRQHARASEEASFENLVKTAQASIRRHSGEFEAHLDELKGRSYGILWRQDWFVVDRFRWFAQAPHLFPDAHTHSQLVSLGTEALKSDEIDKLRSVVAQLDSLRFGLAVEDDMLVAANIVRA